MFQKTVLDNGIRVVTESHRYAKAVCTGVFLETGTRDETAKESGLSHFLEHMVFKGTRNRSAYGIVRELDAVGGDLNAYTTQEYTCFHALTLKEHLPLQMDVLCDLVRNATFSAREITREKTVVLQEIAMSTDDPEEHVFDMFFDDVFEGPLGQPILGSETAVKRFNRAFLKRYYESRYSNRNLIISCAGAVDHETVVHLTEKYLGKMRRRLSRRQREKPKFVPFRNVVPKQTEQVQLVVGLPAATYKDPFRFEAFIMNAFLGGGMTSKLYQSVRERRGLAYTIYSQLVTFTDAGVMTIYAGTDATQVGTVLKLIKTELERLGREKISESDLKLFKTQVRGGLILGSDDEENRMNSLAINEMVFGEYRSVDRVIRDLDRVSAKSLRQYAESFLDKKDYAVLALGNVKTGNIEKHVQAF